MLEPKGRHTKSLATLSVPDSPGRMVFPAGGILKAYCSTQLCLWLPSSQPQQMPRRLRTSMPLVWPMPQRGCLLGHSFNIVLNDCKL